MKTYNIRIDNPCSQDWDKMSESEKGRFCTQCSRHLVDFSVMTDAEIVRTIQGNNGKICGRFAAGQLKRDIKIAATPSKQPMFYRLMAAFLLFFSGTQKDHGTVQTSQTMQAFPGPGDTLHRIGPDGKEEIIYTDAAEGVIKGKVYDGDSITTLSKVKIQLLGTDLEWRSKAQGDFSIDVPDSVISGDTLIFEFSRKGLVTNRLVIHKHSIPGYVRHYMSRPEMEMEMTTGIIIISE